MSDQDKMFDLIVIGAGPAGMNAAITAAHGGARVLLLDEQPRAGGQIYRNVAVNHRQKSYLGQDYAAGKTLVDALHTATVTPEFNAVVWSIDAGRQVVWSRAGKSYRSHARHILLACGAQERPMPFPGWTQPGVMTAGAAQILMKSSGLLPRDAVLVGCGPLLYLIAAQLIDAGAAPQALVETQTPGTLLRAARHLPRALRDARTLYKGMGLLRKIGAAGVRRYTAASGFVARTIEENQNIALSFKTGRRTHQLSTPQVLTHQGVVPATHMSRAAGVAHIWSQTQQAIVPVVDTWGQSDIPSLHIAGDAGGIGGAEAACAAGRLAALNILYQLGHLHKAGRDLAAVAERATLRRAQAIRPFLDAAYAPLAEILHPADETIVCRCEQVSVADIKTALAQGANGPRQLKTAVRVGMGPCQGRMCELTVRAILASSGKQTPISNVRSPIKPVMLGEIAALTPHTETST